MSGHDKQGSAGANGAGSGGEPLPQAVRLSLEQQTSVDLSAVRIQKGFGHGNAAAAARAGGASAYTEGNTIHVGPDAFNSSLVHTDEGKQLIAHEAVHCVQQSQPRVLGEPSPSAAAWVSGPRDPEAAWEWHQCPDGKLRPLRVVKKPR